MAESIIFLRDDRWVREKKYLQQCFKMNETVKFC